MSTSDYLFVSKKQEVGLFDTFQDALDASRYMHGTITGVWTSSRANPEYAVIYGMRPVGDTYPDDIWVTLQSNENCETTFLVRKDSPVSHFHVGLEVGEDTIFDIPSALKGEIEWLWGVSSEPERLLPHTNRCSELKIRLKDPKQPKDQEAPNEPKAPVEKTLLQVIRDGGSVEDMQRCWDGIEGDRYLQDDCYVAAAACTDPAAWKWLMRRRKRPYNFLMSSCLFASLALPTKDTYACVVDAMCESGAGISHKLAIRLLTDSNTHVRRLAKPLIDKAFPRFSTTGHVCITDCDNSLCVTFDVEDPKQFFEKRA